MSTLHSIGTVIIDLNSTDCDSGQNGNVTYSIIGGGTNILSTSVHN